jgi:hypothetical protein
MFVSDVVKTEFDIRVREVNYISRVIAK